MPGVQPEVARARKRLAKGDDVDAVLDALSRGLTQKMLHGAMAELRTRATPPTANRPRRRSAGCFCVLKAKIAPSPASAGRYQLRFQ
jgi:hypothetical protein